MSRDEETIVGSGPEYVVTNPIANRQQGYSDDIEVIDLDDPRGQIKPTTWHY